MSEIDLIRRHYGDFTGLYDQGQAVAHVRTLLAALAAVEQDRDRLLSALRELCDSGDVTGRLIHPGQLRDLIRPHLRAD